MSPTEILIRAGAFYAPALVGLVLFVAAGVWVIHRVDRADRNER